jgi:hypothetical protein
MMLPLFLSLFSALTTPGHAIERHDRRCMARSPEHIHSWLIQYGEYRNLDDGILVEVPVVGRTQLADMIESSVNSRSYRVDTNGSNADVWVVLQPMRLGASDRAYFPRFMLHCESQWDSQTLSGRASTETFRHSCNKNPRFDDEPQNTPARISRNYGLSVFSSRLLVTSDPSQMGTDPCPAGQTLLEYRFNITPDLQHLEVIRARILGPVFSTIPALVDFVNRFFGDEFLAVYYMRFYDAWAARL